MRSQMGLIVCRATMAACSFQFIKTILDPFHGDRLEHIPHAPQCERASSWVYSLCAAFVLSRATRTWTMLPRTMPERGSAAATNYVASFWKNGKT